MIQIRLLLNAGRGYYLTLRLHRGTVVADVVESCAIMATYTTAATRQWSVSLNGRPTDLGASLIDGDHLTIT